MDIPGIASFNGQPTLTNPLSSENQLVGRNAPAQQNSEAATTTTMQEQSPSNLQTVAVVNQTEQSDSAGFDVDNPGSTIDFTV